METGERADDSLSDFEHRTVVIEGISKVVHVAGRGPAALAFRHGKLRTSRCHFRRPGGCYFVDFAITIAEK